MSLRLLVLRLKYRDIKNSQKQFKVWIILKGLEAWELKVPLGMEVLSRTRIHIIMYVCIDFYSE